MRAVRVSHPRALALGVLGGALTFGFIGVFIGPTLLAVGFRLLEEWSPANRAVVAEIINPEPELK